MATPVPVRDMNPQADIPAGCLGMMNLIRAIGNVCRNVEANENSAESKTEMIDGKNPDSDIWVSAKEMSLNLVEAEPVLADIRGLAWVWMSRTMMTGTRKKTINLERVTEK